jgi:hypothetical protein
MITSKGLAITSKPPPYIKDSCVRGKHHQPSLDYQRHTPSRLRWWSGWQCHLRGSSLANLHLDHRHHRSHYPSDTLALIWSWRNELLRRSWPSMGRKTAIDAWFPLVCGVNMELERRRDLWRNWGPAKCNLRINQKKNSQPTQDILAAHSKVAWSAQLRRITPARLSADER